ncbi:hypothetical protein [Mycolicibacterium mucogenicum]|uniref:Uncharacterized protein n=1 Tax=Mycolicibacterium mucogenicum DSM 44124 TaxID=1226753 RepID=A0A8H2JEU2_MYCMU|nr:hypothetical protein [Mycolicibacterium mucogenicum]KAB7755405.1 hypothetical protein MMUC44124_18020 [Mycolicibacterium mucogenicum DSM 44124]QPG68146.1 hypothetical protein C1S78_022055 [Mycolicibacterium mucogenicum DSM 44124]
MTSNWQQAKAVADAVLYEGYLLYPYRATSGKNQSRWQFGVLGPPQAAALGLGEDDTLAAQLLVSPGNGMALTFVVRFLQLQHRSVERDTGSGFEPVHELTAVGRTWLTWDEAVECEVSFGPFREPELAASPTLPIMIPGGHDVEHVDGGRLIRTRAELHAELTVGSEPDDNLLRISLALRNTGPAPSDKDSTIARSLIGTHLIAEVTGGDFVSLLEPPDSAAEAVGRCARHRCFPVLAGPPGATTLMLISPIILYDHPEIAEQSGVALFDSTEIDEILTLRVMTMTDEEKAQARATDPRAADIIDRCDAMSPEALLNLHGVLRNPHAGAEVRSLIPEVPEGVDWWDPLADTAVAPSIDAVLVNGVRVSRDSRVRLHPCRRADAQDLFYADKVARVTCVHETVDGDQQIGVVLEEDPAAEMHDWYGRYLYFAPDEVEPLSEGTTPWK